MSKIIMHADLNAFFATAEELRHPELSSYPLAVGGSGPRSVISTASYLAREKGVHSAMPVAEARRICPSLILLPVDFPYYEMLSRSFFAYLKRFSPHIEEASIDEGYVDLTGRVKGDPYAFFSSIQQGLLKQIGLKCSLGIAPTKFLAKMASDYKKPLGITIIRKRDIAQMLYPLPIESFYGVGKKSAARLRLFGINTIGDFALALKNDKEEVKETLGKFFYTANEWIAGEGSDLIDESPFDPKSIGHSETFPYDTDDYLEIRKHLLSLSRSVAEGAKAKKKKGRTVSLLVRDTHFNNHSKSVSFSEPTDSFEFIYERVSDLFDHNFLGMTVRLLGVTLQNLVDPRKETVQMSFWNFEEYEKMDQTKLLVHELNRKLEKGNLTLLSELKKKGGGNES